MKNLWQNYAQHDPKYYFAFRSMESVQGYFENTFNEINAKAEIFRDKFITDCQWMSWGSKHGETIPCSMQQMRFFSTPEYTICFTFRPPQLNDTQHFVKGGKLNEKNSLETISETKIKGLSVIFYLDDSGYFPVEVPQLHYKMSIAKGNVSESPSSSNYVRP